MIHVDGKYELSDYIKAQKIHNRSNVLLNCVGYYLIGALTLGMIFVIALVLNGLADWTAILYPLAVMAGFLGFQFIFRPRQLAKVFDQQKDLSAPFEMEITEQEFHLKNEFGSINLPWSVFIKAKEDKEMFLLYRSNITFNMLPKRLFQSENDVVLIQEIIQRNIKFTKNNIQNYAWTFIIFILLILAIGTMLYQGLRNSSF